MDLGNLVARITADVSNFKAGLATAQKSVQSFSGTTKSATTAASSGIQGMIGSVLDLSKSVGSASGSMTGFLSTIAASAPQIALVVGALALLAIAIKGLIDLVKAGTAAFQEYQQQLIGLEAVAGAFGINVGEVKQAVEELFNFSGGLVTRGALMQGFKELLAAGASLPQTVDLMKAYVNEASLFRNNTISMDDAVMNLAGSFKTENSMIGNLSGQTENYNYILEVGASMMGKKVSQLSNAERVTAKYLGTMEVAKKAESGAALAADTTAGKISKMKAEWQMFLVTVGAIFDPVLGQLVEILTAIGRAIGFVVLPMLKSFATGLYVVLWAVNLVIKAIAGLINLFGGLVKSVTSLSFDPLKKSWGEVTKDMTSHFGRFWDDIKQIQTGGVKDISTKQQEMFDETAMKQRQLAEDLAKDIAEINEKYADQMEKSNKAFQEQLDDLIYAHLDKVKQLEKQLEEENADFEERMLERKQSFDEAIQDMKDAHAEKVADIESQIAEENQDYADKMASRTEDFDTDMLEMQWSHEDKVEAIQKQIKDEEKSFQDAKDARIRDIMYEIGYELAKRDEASQYRLDQLNQLLEEEKAKTFNLNDEKYQNLLQRLEEENEAYEYDKAKKQKRYDEETAALKKAHEKRLADLQEQLTKENTEYEKSLAKKIADYEKETAKLTEEHNKRVANYQESLDEEKAILDRHQAEVAAAKEKERVDDITRLQRKHADELAEMEKAKNKEIQKAYEKAKEQGLQTDAGLASGIGAGSGLVFNAVDDLGNGASREFAKKGEEGGKTFWQKIWDGMKYAYEQTKKWLQESINWINENPIKWLGGAIDWVKQKGSELVASAKSYWDRAMGWLSSSLKFATGGPVPGPKNRPVPAILHGGEYVVPANGTLLSGGGNGGTTVVVDMAGANVSSLEVAEEYAEAIGDKIIQKLAKSNRGYV